MFIKVFYTCITCVLFTCVIPKPITHVLHMYSMWYTYDTFASVQAWVHVVHKGIMYQRIITFHIPERLACLLPICTWQGHQQKEEEKLSNKLQTYDIYISSGLS